MTPRPPSDSQAPRRLSAAGIDLIKRFEGFRPRAGRLPGGRYVVGYGHVSSTREGVRISEADAHALLVYDLLPIEAAVNEWALAPLTQNQFDALVSFALSVGLKTFRRSNVLRHVNQGSMLQAAGALEMWRQADLDGEAVVVDALVRRRAAEKALFLTPADGHVPASSAVLRPLLDYSAHASIPRRAPETVIVPLDGDVATFTRGPAADGEAAAPEDAAPEAEALLSPETTFGAAEPAEAPQSATDGDIEPEEVAALVEAELGSADDHPQGGSLTEALEADESPSDADEPISAFPTFIAPDEDDAVSSNEADDDDEEWSAARAAAAAVTARLQELLPREEFVDEAEVLPLHPSPEEPDDAEEVLVLTGADTLPEIEPFPLEELESRAGPSTPDNLAPFPAATAANASSEAGELGTEAAAAEPVDPAGDHPRPTPPESVPTGPYLLIGLVGLLFIIAALVSLFRSPAPGEAADGVAAISWILGVLGIAGVAGALWMTLGREEDASGDDNQA